MHSKTIRNKVDGKLSVCSFDAKTNENGVVLLVKTRHVLPRQSALFTAHTGTRKASQTRWRSASKVNINKENFYLRRCHVWKRLFCIPKRALASLEDLFLHVQRNKRYNTVSDLWDFFGLSWLSYIKGPTRGFLVFAFTCFKLLLSRAVITAVGIRYCMLSTKH